MAIFSLFHAQTGLLIRTITGDSFSRAVEAEVTAGRSLASADLRGLGRNGDPTALNLAGGTFSNTVFDGANLTGAILNRANLSGASLKATIQKGSKQNGCIVTGVNETGADTKEREGR